MPAQVTSKEIPIHDSRAAVAAGRRLTPELRKHSGFMDMREDFGIERNQSFKEDHGNAQFSLCCTSTAMPDDES